MCQLYITRVRVGVPAQSTTRGTAEKRFPPSRSQAMQALAGRTVLPAGLRAAAATQRRLQRRGAGLARVTALAPVAPGGRRGASLRGVASARRGWPLLASRERAGASATQPLEQYAGRYGTWTLTEDDRREVWAYRTCLAGVAAGALLPAVAQR